jgi:YaiO family outer membrane protein
MTRFRRLLPLLAACAATSLHAADVATFYPSTTVRAYSGAERLSDGVPGWHERDVGVDFGLQPRETLGLEFGQTNRFGLRDIRFGGRFSTPVASDLGATFEASGSTTHRVLASHVFGAGLNYDFAPAWRARFAARTSAYGNATVNEGTFGLAHDFSDYSIEASWHPTHALGSNVNKLGARASWRYGERSSLALTLAGGREAASVPGGAALADVRSATVTGRHRINRHWAITWSADHTQQGNLYTRKGISLGAEYAF